MRIECIVFGLAISTLAQAQSAQVQMVHNDLNGVVLPGETISLRTIVSWPAPPPFIQFAGLRGDARATGALGSAGNVSTEFWPLYAPPLMQLGVPAGGDVRGQDIATVPSFFLGSPAPVTMQYWGIDYLRYDWTAPAVTVPTLIAFDFVPDAIAPNVRLYPSTNSTNFIEAPTTYVGTTILVLPGPGGAAVFALAMMGMGGRRRRT